MTASPIAKADFIEGLAKGLGVLESFDTERQRLNATQAAERAGITRAAARRHLLTLASLGYLETDGSHYWLSPKVLRFSGSYLASARLPRLVQPALNRLALATRESFSVVVLDGDEVVIVARSASPSTQRLMPYGLHQGTRLPAHATSTGHVLLAAMARTSFAGWLKGRELVRLTPHTMVDPKALRERIERVRQQDFAVAREEHELGVLALAVPLRDMKGRTLAALNVVVSPQRMDGAMLVRDMLPVLQDAAREWRPML
ncbi:MAG: helix-turn-helix domain-containing protein [Hydrogenophaga sp.]|jgi:IclR family pca regulon transcriptional regulator|nr:helix-turn-helix domain-containing protein [Hydrogenophaga sp.]